MQLPQRFSGPAMPRSKPKQLQELCAQPVQLVAQVLQPQPVQLVAQVLQPQPVRVVAQVLQPQPVRPQLFLVQPLQPEVQERFLATGTVSCLCGSAALPRGSLHPMSEHALRCEGEGAAG